MDDVPHALRPGTGAWVWCAAPASRLCPARKGVTWRVSWPRGRDFQPQPEGRRLAAKAPRRGARGSIDTRGAGTAERSSCPHCGGALTDRRP